MPEHADRRVAHFLKLGDELAAKGDYAAAFDHYKTSVDAARDHYGLHDSRLIPLLKRAVESNLKDRLKEVDKRLQTAAELYRWILAIQETAKGFDHVELCPTLTFLAVVYDQIGYHMSAHQLASRAKSIQAK